MVGSRFPVGQREQNASMQLSADTMSQRPPVFRANGLFILFQLGLVVQNRT
jgi:hypothetical protein